MDTTRVKLDAVKRGTLVPTAAGLVVADDVAHTWEDNPRPYLRDTNLGRHFPDVNGTVEIVVPTFDTQATGKLPGKDRASHILLNEVPGRPRQGLCPASRNTMGPADVWQSGTALAGVTCQSCRKMVRLVGTYSTRRSNGI